MSLAPRIRPSEMTITLAKTACLALIALGTVIQTGCLGIASNLMHAVGADMIPAEYEGLEDSVVAVITVTDSSQYSNDVSSRDLSRRVGEVLTKKVGKLRLVREDQIARWRDVHGWDAIDFVEIGTEVGADKVVAIDLINLKLRDGPTLYRGQADVVVQVIDVSTGTIEYSRTMDEFIYPSIAGQYTSETTESRFRKLYLGMLADEIGRSFHAYDFNERIALDSAVAR